MAHLEREQMERDAHAEATRRVTSRLGPQPQGGARPPGDDEGSRKRRKEAEDKAKALRAAGKFLQADNIESAAGLFVEASGKWQREFNRELRTILPEQSIDKVRMR